MKKHLPYLYLFLLLLVTSCAKNEQQTEKPTALPKRYSPIVPVEKVESISQNGMAAKKLPAESVTFTVLSKQEMDSIRLIRQQKSTASLVYYCPTRMLENTDNNVSVTITRAAMADALEQLTKRIEATTGKSQEAIRNSIAGSKIKLSNKMKVELKYSSNDFETIYQPENSDQIFDGENDMNWDWIIKPTRVGSVQLSIIVSAFDEKNGRWIAVQTPPRIFNIKIQVDPRGYFSKLWGFLGNHPEWLFVQILFPVIAFLYGKRKGKKSKKSL